MLDKLKNQELSIFEIIGMAFTIFRENMNSFFNIALILGVPLSLLMTFVSRNVEAATANVDFSSMANNVALVKEFIESGRFKDLVLCEAAWVLLDGLFYPLMTLAIAHMTGEILEGKKADFKESILAAFEKGYVLVPAAIIYQVIVYCGLAFFVIPGIIFTVWFYFYKYAIILDDESIMGSLRLSRFLSKNNFVKIALSLLALFILENAIGNIVGSIFMSLDNNSVMEFVSRCFINVVDTFFWCAAALLYINVRYIKSKQ